MRMETVVQMAAIFKETFSTWAYIIGTATRTVSDVSRFSVLLLFLLFLSLYGRALTCTMNHYVSFYNPIFISKCFEGYNPEAGRVRCRLGAGFCSDLIFLVK